ncbi:MAG TPA: hypothetical protein VGF32_19770 [Streptosporangiaceae bacterium]|jgi:DNA-binding NarL/FixJ family response regulator
MRVGPPGGLTTDRKPPTTSILSALGDALRRVSIGECVIDPEIISQLLRCGRERNPLDALTEREREILSLMAQGYSNDSPESSRRVLAVLAYLQD